MAGFPICLWYGQWIDLAFENIREFLADPVNQKQVLEHILNEQKARRASEADVEDKEKPELSM